MTESLACIASSSHVLPLQTGLPYTGPTPSDSQPLLSPALLCFQSFNMAGTYSFLSLPPSLPTVCVCVCVYVCVYKSVYVYVHTHTLTHRHTHTHARTQTYTHTCTHAHTHTHTHIHTHTHTHTRHGGDLTYAPHLPPRWARRPRRGT